MEKVNESVHEGKDCASCGVKPIKGIMFVRCDEQGTTLCLKCYQTTNFGDKYSFFAVKTQNQNFPQLAQVAGLSSNMSEENKNNFPPQKFPS